MGRDPSSEYLECWSAWFGSQAPLRGLCVGAVCQQREPAADLSSQVGVWLQDLEDDGAHCDERRRLLDVHGDLWPVVQLSSDLCQELVVRPLLVNG